MSPNPELITLAARLYRETESAVAVGRKLGVSTNTVYRLLERAGISRPRSYEPRGREQRRKLTGAAASAAAEAYASGRSLQSIADEFGVGCYAVRTAAKLAGIPQRSRGGKRKNPTAEEIAKAADLYRGGLSQAQVGAAMGWGPKVVGRALSMAGQKARAAKARGKDHGNWRGGRIITPHGYVMLLLDPSDPMWPMVSAGNYVFEHRLVVARSLGRPLYPHETVHHIDGDKSNNQPENLQLRFGKHGKGVAMACAKCGSQEIAYVKLEVAPLPK